MRQSNTIFSDEEKNKESLSRILREIKKLEIADFLLFSRRSAILFLQKTVLESISDKYNKIIGIDKGTKSLKSYFHSTPDISGIVLWQSPEKIP